MVCVILSTVNQKHLATSLCSVLQGIGVSGVYSLTLSLPYEYNLFVSESTLSTLMLVMMLSEGIIVFPTGLLMKKVSIEVFFFSLLIFSSIMLINSQWVICELKKEGLEGKISEDAKINEDKFIEIE